MNQIITVDQQAVLTSRFDAISNELDSKRQLVEGMIVSEESYKDAKAIRASLNKEAKEYADEFKAVKEQVLRPWNDIEAEYKSKISGKYSEMDQVLKEKIYEIEDGLKAKKKTEIEEYFNELKVALDIGFVKFSDTNVKVGLSNSLTSLKKEVKEWCENIADTTATINAMPDGAEIFAEWQRNGFYLAQAIDTVNRRHEAIEQAKALQEKKQAEAEAEAERVAEMEKVAEVEKVEVVEAPKEEKTYCAEFRVVGTMDQFKALKSFLVDNEIRFEMK